MYQFGYIVIKVQVQAQVKHILLNCFAKFVLGVVDDLEQRFSTWGTQAVCRGYVEF